MRTTEYSLVAPVVACANTCIFFGAASAQLPWCVVDLADLVDARSRAPCRVGCPHRKPSPVRERQAETICKR